MVFVCVHALQLCFDLTLVRSGMLNIKAFFIVSGQLKRRMSGLVVVIN